MAKDLSHVMMLEVEHHIGPYRMEEVVLFNSNRISEEEAYQLVQAGEYNDNVLCIPKKQWISLFNNGEEACEQ